ncbi:MAG TPA: hypothetical protein VJC16_00985 [Candidatus Nanoarchaeia archaeon]|nr:hypothetical protein [Candidatus Nanoarchaeia archaeon]
MFIGKKGQEADQSIVSGQLVSLLLKIIIGIALLAAIYSIARRVLLP